MPSAKSFGLVVQPKAVRYFPDPPMVMRHVALRQAKALERIMHSV